MEKITINVTGMSCEHCVKAVTNALTALDGVSKAKVKLKGGTADVKFDPSKVTIEALKAAIVAEGFEVA